MIALIFVCSRFNKYSINALAGVCEKERLDEIVKIFFIKEKELYILKELSQNFKKLILCFSFSTLSKNRIFSIKEEIKKLIAKKIIFIAGGPHPTGLPQEVIENNFDIVVKGEAEKIFPKIVKTIASNKYLEKILSSKDYVNLDEYPPFSLRFRRLGPIEITRGCPYGCYFCQTSWIFGKKIRHRSILKIAKYLEILRSRGILDFRFISPNAFSYGSKTGKNVNLKALEEFLRVSKEVVGKDGRIYFGTFPSEVRPDFITSEVMEIISKYVYNRYLVVGAQSGSDRILSLCRRGHTVSDIEKAAKILKKFNFSGVFDFLFGLPYEEEKDRCESFKLINYLISLGMKIRAHTFIPLPQTPFFLEKVTEIDLKTKEFLGKLAKEGKLTGSWSYQEKLRQSIKLNK